MHKLIPYILIGLIAANASVYGLLARRYVQKPLSIDFLSVGQGDAELVRAGRINFLIDTGPSSKTIQALDDILGQGRRVIDVVMLTHPNSDHVAGFLELAKRYTIRLLVTNGIGTTDPIDASIAELAKANRIPVVFARRGMVFALDNAYFSVLWPGTDLGVHAAVSERKLNDTAIAGVLSLGSARALFTGDISSAVEKQISALLGRVGILKVAHHGSKTSTSDAFLAAVQPVYAVIEAGKNSYGLPSQDVLSRLRAAGAKVLRTDMDGTVSFFVQNNAWVPD